MNNDNIKIEIEMKDSTALFAVKRMIGYKVMHKDNYKVDLQLAHEDGGEEKRERNSLIFTTNLKGFEYVARIVEGIEDLKLGKQEEEEKED